MLINGGWTLSAILHLQMGPFSAVGGKNNGDGTFTVIEPANGSFSSSSALSTPIVSGFGSSREDYVSLVESTGGYFWTINAIRRGGEGAKALTDALLDTALVNFT